MYSSGIRAAGLLGLLLVRVATAHAQAPSQVAPPRLVIDSPATYPQQAVTDHVAAPTSVVLVLQIDDTGAVTDAAVEAPQGHGFDEAALAAARQLHFEPARRDGAPVAVKIKFRYDFPAAASHLHGRVLSAADDAPIAGATVTIRDAAGAATTVISGADGAWLVDALEPGVARIVVTADGYDEQALQEDMHAAEDTALTVRLATTPVASAPPPAAGATQDDTPIDVTVHGEKPPREVTRRTMTQDEISEIPGTGGDALKSLLSLPGVARPPLISGALIVRGSAPADTGLYIDQVQVPIVYHFGGLSSVIPTELIDTLVFEPGNFSAAYGRSMGGVVDVGLRMPKTDGFHALASVDFIDARTVVEGPIDHDWSFLVGARRSYFDLWLRPILDHETNSSTGAPSYYDYQAELVRRFSADSTLRFLVFGANDSFNSTDGGPSINQRFWRALGRYDTPLGAHAQLVATLSYGVDNSDANFGEQFSQTKTNQVDGRIEVTDAIAPGVTAHVGTDVIYAPYDLHQQRRAPAVPGVPAGSSGTPPILVDTKGTQAQPGAYTEWELDLWPGGHIVPGFRIDYDHGTGQWDYSPRLAMRQQLGDRLVLKGGVGRFYEPPAPNQIDLAAADPTLAAAAGLSTQRSTHYDLGFELSLTPHLELSNDGFYKSLDRLAVTGLGSVGSGYTYGDEVMLRYKPDDHFFGWISYTYSRSMRRNTDATALYPFTYDQPHVLTVLGSYKLSGGRWQLGARFRFVSGDPYTPSTYGAYDAGASENLAVTGNPPNSMRLPNFYALDIRIEHVWQFERWKMTGYLDISNVTNAANPESIGYNYNFTQSQFNTGLPILPSIGVRGEL